MKQRSLFVMAMVALSMLVSPAGADTTFVRGDVNADGTVDLSDPILALFWLFQDAPDLPCLDAADADDNGAIEITDALRILNFLFLSGNRPEKPFPNCGPDPSADPLDCRSYPLCGGLSLPPDPGEVAPPIDPSLATSVLAATEFLYRGNDPIQTGVAAGTIDGRRVTVIRGRVLDREDQPLAGVTIAVLGHAEFGGTLSRLDGAFDMAVNGGGWLTITYPGRAISPPSARCTRRGMTTPGCPTWS